MFSTLAQVRFRCIPGITEMTGRIYTDVHGREDDPDFHANRLHETPKVVDESDGFKAELAVHLNDGQDCEVELQKWRIRDTLKYF